MPRVGERILVTQSPCARDASLRALSKEVTEKESRGGRARVPSVASYPRTVYGVRSRSDGARHLFYDRFPWVPTSLTRMSYLCLCAGSPTSEAKAEAKEELRG